LKEKVDNNPHGFMYNLLFRGVFYSFKKEKINKIKKVVAVAVVVYAENVETRKVQAAP
jgi:hypothetical protein